MLVGLEVPKAVAMQRDLLGYSAVYIGLHGFIAQKTECFNKKYFLTLYICVQTLYGQSHGKLFA
jgi:hypothetical protein